MKVISIREPYATLIKDKVKTIETRSWKTNYRGKIYIHSCVAKSRVDDSIKSLIKSELKYGYILCEANLVDCVYMDDEYIERIKKDDPNNYLTGIYQVGRYGWFLEDVKVLSDPIYVKGKLGLWNYDK